MNQDTFYCSVISQLRHLFLPYWDFIGGSSLLEIFSRSFLANRPWLSSILLVWIPRMWKMPFCLTGDHFKRLSGSHLCCWRIYIYNFMSGELMSSEVDWGLKLSSWAHLEMLATKCTALRFYGTGIYISMNHACCLHSAWPYLLPHLIAVSQVNKVNLLRTSSSWRSRVKFSPR